jgi:hypothetical protein
MLAAMTLLAGLFALGFAGGAFLPAGVARADVIDEYTEPPPPAPEPTPNPSPSGGGKPSNAGGGSGSQADSGASYSYDTSSTAPTPAASNAAKSKKSQKTVAPRASEAAAIALEPAAANSSFLSAAFGGVGWVLPTLMILIAIGAAFWTRLNRPKVRSSRASRARP